jgi:AraC family transcriptional regulator
MFDVNCHTPRSGYGPMMFRRVAQVVLPRRGVYVMEARARPIVIDTTTVVLTPPDAEYRILHPVDGGDDATIMWVAPSVLEDAFGRLTARVGRLQPHDHFRICLLTHAFRNADADLLQAEDSTLRLLASLRWSFTDLNAPRYGLGRAQMHRVEQARTLLANSPTRRWDLAGLGRALSCSPFHLARQFRLGTGETISRYLLRLRLALALERLAEGETNLAALALDVGFAHHSHFSARFRSVYGITPAHARQILTKRKLAELETLGPRRP